ncbi:MAG: hypothetical protein AAFV53_39275 [Myxococcota bacterium]
MRVFLLLPALLALSACSGDTQDTAEAERDSIRGQRVCELNELIIEDDTLKMLVWNDVGLHDCPDEWLEQIDPEVYAIGGPRWRSVDQVFSLGDTPDATPEEVPAGLGYQMAKAATVDLFDVATLEDTLDVTIETVDDIPQSARNAILETTLRSTEYAVSEVARSFSTEFIHYAGQTVFVLDDGDCQYAMKYYTSIYDEELVNEDVAATLGDRLSLLPEGYSFSVQTFDEDLVITEDSGVQYVLVDELGNSYDRFACD